MMFLHTHLLFTAVFLSFLNAFLSLISKCIMFFVKWEPVPENLKKEITELRRQLNQISVVQEFAKYFKIERRLNQLQDNIKKEVQVKMKKRRNINSKITAWIQAITICLNVSVFLWCRMSPVVELRNEWLSPFGMLLSWPLYQPGLISFPIWFLTCNSVAKVIASLLKVDPAPACLYNFLLASS